MPRRKRDLEVDPAALELGGGRGARQRGLGYWQNSTGGERRLFTGVGNFLYQVGRRDGGADSVVR